MAKGPSIITETPTQKSQIPQVKAIHPFGSMVMIEELNSDEALGTSLYVGKSATEECPQAYIIELGPSVSDECGLAVGQRIIVQGKYFPVKNTSDSGRKRGLIEIHNIKGIVEEELS